MRIMKGEHMKREKVCEAFDNYGESAPECEWLFKKRSRNEKYCDSCKALVRRIQVKQAVDKHRNIVRDIDDVTDIVWYASHIDLLCTCCGNKGVPIQHRCLCIACHTSDEARAIEHGDTDRYMPTWNYTKHYEEESPHGQVKQYSCKDMSQEQLQEILND
jgi:hypothetical protein